MRKNPCGLAVLTIGILLVAGCSLAPSPVAEPAKPLAPAPAAPAPAAPAPEVQREKYFAGLGTSSVGSTYHVIGSGITDVIGRAAPYISLTAEITGGAVENTRLVGTGKMEFGMVGADSASDAYRGLGQFPQAFTNLRGVMTGPVVPAQVSTLESSNIKTFYDIKGKKVSIGPPGSVWNAISQMTLELYGLQPNIDYTPVHLGHGEAGLALVDGNVDVTFFGGGVPHPALVEASVKRPIRVLDHDPNILKQLLTTYPFFVAAKVPANTYRGQTQAVENTFGLVTIIIADAAVPEHVVYDFVKAVQESGETLKAAHPDAQTFVHPGNAAAITAGLGSIPLHPGLEKYLNEIKR